MTKEELELLAGAIRDVGCWNWWGERLPRAVQVEFIGTLLLLGEGGPGQPPDSRLALSFAGPVSVAFLSGAGAEEGWPGLLREDRLGPLTCDHDRFTFTDGEQMAAWVASAARVETVFGEPPLSPAFLEAPAKLVFWAGDKGFAVAAERMTAVTRSGTITGPELGEAHRKWWDYWREYWRRRGTGDPLPRDYACEVTIPIRGPEK